MRLRQEPRAAARKRATNLTVDVELLEAARAAGINLSAELEQRLRHVLRERARAAWLEENRAAIDSDNAGIEKRSVFSNGLRRF